MPTPHRTSAQPIMYPCEGEDNTLMLRICAKGQYTKHAHNVSSYLSFCHATNVSLQKRLHQRTKKAKKGCCKGYTSLHDNIPLALQYSL